MSGYGLRALISRDWHALSLARRGHPVHVRTDPLCVIHRAPKPGSRLDAASRGVYCPRCSPSVRLGD